MDTTMMMGGAAALCFCSISVGASMWYKNTHRADELQNALGAVKNRPVDEAVPILKSMFPGLSVMPRGTQQKRTKDTVMYTVDGAGHINTLGLNGAGVANF
jgi:hypothetical protein